MSIQDKIKLFGMSHQMAERELDRVEKECELDLARDPKVDPAIDELYYPQFDAAIRAEALKNAAYYPLFYCLEKSIRQLIKEKMRTEFGPDWWENEIQDHIKNKVRTNMEREQEWGVSPRSTEEIDYTTFGELGEIVKNKWAPFADTFNNVKAFTKIMNYLNVLRGPIAHSSPLADDEVVRLQLTVRDWFRLME